MQSFTLGFSSCPNDTYIFDALVHRRIPHPFEFLVQIHDVEELNQKTAQGLLDISKVSVHAWFHQMDRYQMLGSGGALGRGCGPLLISRTGQLQPGAKVALPGAMTTAALLFGLAVPERVEILHLRFDQIMPAILSGQVDAGVIIHESRFTYQSLGLKLVLDLGAWWEEDSGCPLPLGGIIVKRELASLVGKEVEGLIKASIEHSDQHPEDARPFIEAHALEMAPEVIDQHIGLYVNQFSKDLGTEGRQAIGQLYHRASKQGLLPEQALGFNAELFV